ncbi:unnamed protein product [Auanema sp. JU1783]|nr:unnamed protein product [Auanema sp. JU1783]
MVCATCEKKLTKIVGVDPYRNKLHNKSLGGGVSKAKPSGSTNKLIGVQKKATIAGVKCKLCKCSIHQVGSHYCQNCAYEKGICAMCGKKIQKVAGLRQSNV